jgi:hypothetical protein
MKNWLFRGLVVVAFAACSKGGGGLSKDSVKDYREHIDMSLSYDDAVKAATDKFGAPTKADAKKTTWVGKDGDKCFAFFLENYSGKAGNGVESTDCPN